ncbi:MAG: CBS domain-containing protein [Magnetococcales bacterium]|nr:CBS domain-containing protein [Magnetococcales bacterium]
MPTSEEQILKKARPFFLNFFTRLANDLNTLTAAPITCVLKDLALVRGREEMEPIFETDRTIAYVLEDGKNSGDIHIIMDVATSISLAGLMMMIPEAAIQEQVKGRKYNEEVNEGFQEIANQVVGAMNDLVEKKVEGSHLFLVLPTSYTQYAEFPDSIPDHKTYLSATVDIQVSKFPVEPSVWILSKGLCEILFKVDIEGTAEENKATKTAAPAPEPIEAAPAPEPVKAAPPPPPKATAAPKPAPAPPKPAPPPLVEEAPLPAQTSPAPTGGKKSDADPGKPAPVAKPTPEALPPGHPSGLESPLMDGVDMASGAEKKADLLTEFGSDDRSVGESGMGSAMEGLQTAGKKSYPPLPNILYGVADGLPHPDEPGSVRAVTTVPPFALKVEDRVIKAIHAMRQKGYRYIGVEHHGKLVRVVSQSDLRQLMGPFFGTQAMSARDKAICTLPLGKINETQRLVSIPLHGSISQAATLMQEYALRMLPVVSKQGVLRGYVPVHALLDYYRRKKQK